jgi:CubicO group peptidase (beta-lactamase class C family)
MAISHSWIRAVIACAVLSNSTRTATAQSPAVDGARQDLRTLERFGFSGAVLIAEKHTALLAEGYGSASDDPADHITVGTLFDIGSLAKQFTAAAILTLETEKKLAVTDSVARFFPAAPPEIGVMTIHQLLTHTSGLQRGNLTTEETTELDPLTRDSALARLFRTRPRFAPGSQQAYSNAGYVLLAAIVEVASGRPYRELVRERLWHAAGLRGARFWGEPGGHVALGKDDLGVIADPRKFPAENWSIRGAGGMLLSVDDLRQWFDALYAGRVIPQSDVRRMMSRHAGPYGYGWRVDLTRGDSNSVFHGGDYHGVGSQLIWQPSRERLIIVLSNIRHEDDNFPTRVRAEEAILARLDGARVSLPALLPARRPLELLPGVYTASSGGRFRIERDRGSLFLGALNQAGTAFLAPARSPDSAAYRSRLTERTEAVIRGALAKDSAAVRQWLSAKDDPPYVYEQLVQELNGVLRGRPVSKVAGLGTYPAAIPAGALWSPVALVTRRDTVYYMLRWHQDVVASYHARSPRVAARLFVAPSGTGWTAWDIVRNSVVVSVERVTGTNNRQLRLTNGADTTVITRER